MHSFRQRWSREFVECLVNSSTIDSFPGKTMLTDSSPGKTMPKPKSPFTGRWHFLSMTAWDETFLNEEVQAYIAFDDQQSGEFHFGFVHGLMDCRLTTRDGEPAIEWTWDGNDEMDPALGRGWAVVKAGELHGMIFFH